MKGIYKITLFLLFVGFLAACSRKKNTFLNRNLNALATEYNILYHGEISFEDARKQLAAGYRDNFWEILPVERIEVKEAEAKTLVTDQSTPFSRAEEKATKAIQKRSMNIHGKEYNPQIDEAYVLLGKARYYDGRFIPALDAFNYILNRFPASNSINQAKIWRAKTNIRLRNEESAIDNLTRMFKYDKLEPEEIADGAAMLAQAYINLDSIPAAIPYIQMASKHTRDNELKGRYYYIEGQLYNQLEKRDSADLAFDKVIGLHRKTSRAYYINAHIAKGINFDYENEDKTAFRELLEDLKNDRENRPYLDRIHYMIAEYYYNLDSIPAAVEYYNKSIAAFRDDRILQSKNYQTLAEINFDRAEYRNAGAYYDSTLTFLKEKTAPWRRIKKKRDNLDDVIEYEEIAVVNDSILTLTRMSEEEQLAFFTDYTTRLKEKAIRDSIEAAKREQEFLDLEFYKKGRSSESGEGSTFYFYNPTAVAYGKQEFRKIWGNRSAEDNWRLSDRQSSPQTAEDGEGEAVPIAENERFKPETYIARIPTDEKAIDSITRSRDNAYYQLGLIYKEKFREYPLAINRFETLLSYHPEERFIVPAQYHLFKTYELMERPDLGEKYKNNILTQYPDTRYAEILRNPEAEFEDDESSPEYRYKQLYREFEAHRYAEVIDQCDAYLLLFEGNAIIPKLEFLKATAIGLEQGYEAYKEAINYVALNYANTPEGRQAQKIYDETIPMLVFTQFEGDNASDQWKLVYQFKSSDLEAAENLKEKLDKAIDEANFFNVRTSIDYYSPEYRLVVIHGLNSRLGARGFGESLKERKEYKIKHPFFEISKTNYKTIQVHKNLNTYFEKMDALKEI